MVSPMGCLGMTLLAGCLLVATQNESVASSCSEDSLATLTSQTSLPRVLQRIARRAFHAVGVGPLIQNGRNQGLIDIDEQLDPALPVFQEVCGPDTAPTIRQAVLCTIEANGRGNTDPSRIGYSTQGREILAARIGRRGGARVMVITQQHGNEVAGTEAALRELWRLSRRWGWGNRSILRHLDILLVLRANPDGGDPAPECARELPVGEPFFGQCALTRQNVDPSAGGGFVGDSEPDFFGVVGQGYNLNRYHHVGLDRPIRPLENQAMVAAALAFRPNYVLDLHGDVPKTDCALDLESLVPDAVLGALPSVECLEDQDLAAAQRQFSVFADAHPDSARDIEARALGAAILERVAWATDGSVGRFSQLQLAAGTFDKGTTEDYQQIGSITGGWESANFGLDLRPDVQAFVNGEASIGPNTYLVDASNLAHQIRLNRVALRQALRTIARFQRHPPPDEGSFCAFPLANGFNGRLPPELFGPIPEAGAPLIVPIVPSLGIPVSISGACPGD